MATKKTAQLPYRWSNGSYHSRPEQKHHGQMSATYTPQASAPPKASALTAIPATPAATLPPDPAYANAQVTNTRNLQLANADYTYGVGQLQQRFGLEDTSNPFSEAAMLRESYMRGQTGTENQFASSGQLYSGAYGRAQGENTRNYAIADDQMRRQYADMMHNLQRGQLGAQATYGTNMTDADWTRLMAQYGGGR